MKRIVILFSLLSGVLPQASLHATPAVVTATFQEGTSGYMGTVDRRIAANAASELNGSSVNTDATSYFIDGGASALNDAGVTQGLIRFDNFVGAGGVPVGAKIISATVDMTTGTTSNAQTGGVYNLYQLSTPFDPTATWAGTFGGNGLAGDTSDLLGSYDDLDQGAVVGARADNAVQQWVNGAPNLGFGIRSDRSTDGWSPQTTGSATVTARPKLTVNYTVDPLVEVKSYQDGVGAYSGATDLRLNDSVVGSSVQETFIDGFDAAAASKDQPYLIRFDGLDLSYAQIYKAELVLTTGFSSSDAGSGGPFTVHQMLKDWSTSTAYADLDSDADPTLNSASELMASGTIGPAAASIAGLTSTEVMYVDVTSIVENWRAGQANDGFYIGATGTSNGWQIFTTGANDATVRPELRIIGVKAPEPAATALFAMAVSALLPFARSGAAERRR
jgi:hypothetical protein